jgi:starch synthase
VLSGILNGVDTKLWDPQTDAVLPHRYGVDDADVGKAAAKTVLRARFALADMPAPLFGVVSRLTAQKGLDLLLGALPALLDEGAQLALLGSGDHDLEAGFAAAAAAHPGSVGVVLGYDEALSRLIFAGSDGVLVPSRFEPCGLTQMYALRYGALPLVRHTGGLVDTVVDADAATLADGSATGFAFDDASPAALATALARATALYADPVRWRRMVSRAMTGDFSWAASARRYVALYEELIASRRGDASA